MGGITAVANRVRSMSKGVGGSGRCDGTDDDRVTVVVVFVFFGCDVTGTLSDK